MARLGRTARRREAFDPNRAVTGQNPNALKALDVRADPLRELGFAKGTLDHRNQGGGRLDRAGVKPMAVQAKKQKHCAQSGALVAVVERVRPGHRNRVQGCQCCKVRLAELMANPVTGRPWRPSGGP
jgi:hypothetical protein